MKEFVLLNQFTNGLWTSDHAGVLSVLKVPGGKKKQPGAKPKFREAGAQRPGLSWWCDHGCCSCAGFRL